MPSGLLKCTKGSAGQIFGALSPSAHPLPQQSLRSRGPERPGWDSLQLLYCFGTRAMDAGSHAEAQSSKLNINSNLIAGRRKCTLKQRLVLASKGVLPFNCLYYLDSKLSAGWNM